MTTDYHFICRLGCLINHFFNIYWKHFNQHYCKTCLVCVHTIQDYCVRVITETCLDPFIPHTAINNSWCTNATVKEVYCCPDIEYLLVQCRPFYLQRELASFVITVYLPLQANTKLAKDRSINQQLTMHPNCFIIAAGDFNHANLKSVLLRLYKNMYFPTRGPGLHQHHGCIQSHPPAPCLTFRSQ